MGEDGKQIGVIKTSEALAYAQERDLDLVEVAPDARPPVCRVLDYSKYKYEQAQKLKAARKHQQQITIREIKFRPKIAQNDYDTKKGHVKRFLLGRDRVKVTIMFRGREVTHPERGTALLEKLAGELVRDRHRRADPAPGRAQHDDDAGALQVRAGGREGRQAARRGRGPRHEGRSQRTPQRIRRELRPAGDRRRRRQHRCRRSPCRGPGRHRCRRSPRSRVAGEPPLPMPAPPLRRRQPLREAPAPEADSPAESSAPAPSDAAA